MPAWIIPALGLALQGLGMLNKNKQQRQQQNALNEDAMAQNKRMGEWNQEKQMEMWEKTGPAGMAKQLDRAGLNRALMYGGTGAGGQSSNTAQAEGVKAGNAQGKTGQEEAQMSSMAMGLANQVALQKAQIENIKADTEVKKQDAAATGGYKAELAGAQTGSLVQGVENAKAQEALTRVQERIAEINEDVATNTFNDVVQKVMRERQILGQELERITRDNSISEATKQTKIRTASAELAEIIASAGLKDQMGEESKSRIEVNLQEIKKKIADIIQGYDRINVERSRAETERNKRNDNRSDREDDEATQMISNLFKLGTRAAR